MGCSATIAPMSGEVCMSPSHLLLFLQQVKSIKILVSLDFIQPAVCRFPVVLRPESLPAGVGTGGRVMCLCT